MAALDEKQDLLAAVLELLPLENWYTHELLNIALATENKYILDKLNYSASEINRFRQREEAWMQHAKMDYLQILSKAVKEGNYFKTAYIASKVAPYNLYNEFLVASELGLVGIVKILVEIGKVNPIIISLPHYHSLKKVSIRGYHKLKRYLLRKGIKKQELE